MTTDMIRLEITNTEAASIRSLLDAIKADRRNLNQYHFLDQATLFAQELPRRLRETFYRFKREEGAPILLVRNNPVLAQGPGPTPSRHIELDADYELNDANLLHGLYGSLLGEAIGYTSQRDGSVYNNIIALPDYQKLPNSSGGSTYDFGFHVEDAFHPARSDFIGLACMRNNEGAATTISCIEGINLSDAEQQVLFQPRFRISHNPIHATSGVVKEEGQEILFGHPGRPYVRINAATLKLNEYSGLERQALEKVLDHFNRNKVSVVLQSRDCIYIDNYRCVHARDSFKAQFGPEARWLVRVVFTCDLRKSQAMRKTRATRAIAA